MRAMMLCSRRTVGLAVALSLCCPASPAAAGAQPHLSPRDHRSARSDIAEVYNESLAGLLDKPFRRSPLLGGQVWKQCCAKVVNASVAVVHTDDGLNNVTSLSLQLRRDHPFFWSENTELLEQYPQFPCTAKNNGNNLGPPPLFWTSFSWCDENCPGWELTQPDDLETWLRPLIMFVLPSLVFCFFVPRRRRFIDLPAEFFSSQRDTKLSRWLVGPPAAWLFPKLLVAALAAALDTVVWLSVCFAVAGPILLSGTFEAMLDHSILDFLGQQHQDHAGFVTPTITPRERVHTLLAILLGNLDDEASWDRALAFVRRLGGSPPPAPMTPLSPLSRSFSIKPGRVDIMPPILPSITGTRRTSFADPASRSPLRGAMSAESMKIRLRSMVDLQHSFGSSVGAPVLFYVGGFIYGSWEVRVDLGNSVTAHQLAIGMFWMVIPHVALASCLLLSGNSPSVLEAVTERDISNGAIAGPGGRSLTRRGSMQPGAGARLERAMSQLSSSILLGGGGGTADDREKHQSAWMWNRGWTKARWVARLARHYPSSALAGHVHDRMMIPCSFFPRPSSLSPSPSKEQDYQVSRPTRDLRRRFCNARLWASALVAFVLVFLPVLLGTFISWTTPQVGLGCRSLTFIAYGLAQSVLILLWVADWCFWKSVNVAADDAELDDDENGEEPWGVPSLGQIVWYLCFLPAVAFGFVASIGGTIFILIGLHDNCFCETPARYWRERLTHPNALVSWGRATQEMIDNARHYWFSAGIAGTVVLAVIAYVGWWYQRSVRMRFHALVASIDHEGVSVSEEGRRPSGGTGSVKQQARAAAAPVVSDSTRRGSEGVC